MLPNTQYLYKFINGNVFGDDELENRSLLTVDENVILEPVCFNSIELCDFFDGIELASLEFTTNLSNAIANNGFTLGNLIIVRWGYADTQLIERTDTLNAEGFGTNFSKTIEIPKINLEKGLFYQYYKIVDNIQFREVYFNFDYNGDDQNLAERRFFNFDENTLEGIPELSEDLLDSSHLINPSMFSSLHQSSSSFEIGKRLIRGKQNQEQSGSLQDSLSQGLETLQDDVSIPALQDASGIIDAFENDLDTIEQKFDWDDDFLGNSQFDFDEEEDTLHLNRKVKSEIPNSNVVEKSDSESDFFEEDPFESRTNWGYLQKSEESDNEPDMDEHTPNPEKEVQDFNINLDIIYGQI